MNENVNRNLTSVVEKIYVVMVLARGEGPAEIREGFSAWSDAVDFARKTYLQFPSGAREVFIWDTVRREIIKYSLDGEPKNPRTSHKEYFVFGGETVNSEGLFLGGFDSLETAKNQASKYYKDGLWTEVLHILHGKIVHRLGEPFDDDWEGIDS